MQSLSESNIREPGGKLKLAYLVTLNVPPTLHMNCVELVKLRRNDDDEVK